MGTGWKFMLARACVLAVLVSAGLLAAQQAPKPLTNADVVKMAKAGLAESTIIAAIQANPTDFDVSPDALIALKKAGVPAEVMNAMAAASKASPRTQASPPAAPPVAEPGGTTPGTPSVQLLADGSAAAKGGRRVAVEKTQLAETKTKASTLSALSRDSVLNQAFQAGVSTAAFEGMVHSGSYAGSTAIGQAGSVFGGLMSHHSNPTLTYVWALPAATGPTFATGSTPRFAINFAGVAGVNAEEYAPEIVRLTTTPNNWRLVGATEGKQDQLSNPALDWAVYSSFVEDRVGVNGQKLGSGNWEVSPTAALAPGQYGVVVRPVSSSKKFKGQDVGSNRGDGQLFNSVWPFEVK